LKLKTTLGEHFEAFIAQQIDARRFASASQATWPELRLLEEHETKLQALQRALREGEDSGLVDYSLQGLLQELDRGAVPNGSFRLNPIQCSINRQQSASRFSELCISPETLNISSKRMGDHVLRTIPPDFTEV
jgi:antitoxin ParD1/3/4